MTSPVNDKRYPTADSPLKSEKIKLNFNGQSGIVQPLLTGKNGLM